jgi:uncharacterized protein YggL (DUF469 family)
MKKRLRKKKHLGEFREFGFAVRDNKLDGFVTRAGRGSATEEDRAAMAAFLDGATEIARRDVGALRDAWHGWD